nr:hypothetical protein [Ardenticatena sp.]
MNRQSKPLFVVWVVAWLLSACTPATFSPTPTATRLPSPTASPTATPLLPPTALPSSTPRPPTPTPNVQLVPETYTHPDGLFSIRLPIGWQAHDLSGENELLMRFDAPPTTAYPARVLVNILNTGAPLDAETLPALADAYLQAFLQTLFPLVEPTIATDNGLYTVEVASPVPDPQQQVRLRFLFDMQETLLVVLIQESTTLHWEAVEPVLTSVTSSFTLAPDAAERLPVSAPPEDARLPTLTLTRTLAYTSPTGTLHLLGVARNSSPRAYADVLARVRLFDADGLLLTETEWPLPLLIAPAGIDVPFEVLLPTPPPNWATWDVAFVGRPVSTTVQGPLPYTLTVAQETATFGAYAVQARVRNATTATLDTLWAVGALYDENNRPLAVERLDLHESLPPGATTTVQLLFAARAPGKVADVRLLVFGSAQAPPAP